MIRGIENKKEAEDLIVNAWLQQYQEYGYGRYALIHKADDKVIGFCGVKFETELGCPDIGYRMLPEYWGQGLATEAVTATLEYAKSTLGLTSVIGEVLVEHPASGSVLIKSGLKLVDTYEREGYLLNRYE